MENQKEKLDGIEPLLALFDNNSQKFIDHIIENTLFFPPEVVIDQAKAIVEQANENIPITVRHCQSRGVFRTKDKKIKTSTRKDGIARTKVQDIFHIETDIQIKFDGDGNTALRKQINDITSLEISRGEKGSIVNYIISHLWENTSNNPLFFSLLWNVVLAPRHLDFIIDKSIRIDDTCIRDIIKAISLELYAPEKHMGKYSSKIKDKIHVNEHARRIAQEYISKGKIKFISKSTGNQDIAKENKITITNKIMEQVSESNIELSNKDFVFSSLNRLSELNIDFVQYLVDSEFCKNVININFPILKRKTSGSNAELHLDAKGYRRYYSSPELTINDTQYLVCNHWFKLQRDSFTTWINKIEKI